MKRISLISILLSFVTVVQCQQWYPLAGGVVGAVQTIEADIVRNKIYVAGNFTHADTVQSVDGFAQWHGTYWERIGATSFEVGLGIRHIMKIFDDTLYLGGFFYAPNNYMAIWPMAGSWQPHSPSSDFSGLTSSGTLHGGIDDFIIYNNDLYAAGSFINANMNTPYLNQPNNIARWNGTFWETVGTPPGVSKYESPFDISFIEKMLVYNNELFIFGSFDSVGGISAYNVAKWNGSIWSDVDGSHVNHPPIDPGGLFCATNYNGSICTAGSYFAIHQWNGSNWSVIGNTNHSVYDMIEYNGDLVVTGAFTTINGITVNGIARWDGQNWHPFGTGLAQSGQPFGYGVCLEILNTDLYVGGYFDSVDGVAANGIARYGWQTNVLENSNEFNLSLYPNPATSELNISFNLEKVSHVNLQLYNSLGQLVKTISDKKLHAGENKINFSTETLPAGVYYLQLKVDEETVIRKVIIKME
jgi:trimeric autotransporter adhesin